MGFSPAKLGTLSSVQVSSLRIIWKWRIHTLQGHLSGEEISFSRLVKYESTLQMCIDVNHRYIR